MQHLPCLQHSAVGTAFPSPSGLVPIYLPAYCDLILLSFTLHLNVGETSYRLSATLLWVLWIHASIRTMQVDSINAATGVIVN